MKCIKPGSILFNYFSLLNDSCRLIKPCVNRRSSPALLIFALTLTGCGGGGGSTPPGGGGGGGGAASLFPAGITLVSLDSAKVEAADLSKDAAISSDGRYVVFTSSASNLVVGDNNGFADIFVHDRLTGETTRESLASGGGQGNERSSSPSISDDGRFVAFISSSSNLVGGDTNGMLDAFVHDRQTGGTSRVSVKTGGIQGDNQTVLATISGNGEFVAMASLSTNLVDNDTNGTADIFVHDRLAGTTTRVSVPSVAVLQSNGNSSSPAISADGRFVTFSSTSTNLVSDDSNNFTDIFVHDRNSASTDRVSIPSGGVLESNAASTGHIPSISDDGRYVAFASDASNLGANDTNGVRDIFIHDRTTLNTFRVSKASNGTQGDNTSTDPVISADGGYVAFTSIAGNLVSGDSNLTNDIFRHDRQAGTTVRISLNVNGDQAAGQNGEASISADGKNIAFESDAANLVFGTNGARQGLIYTVTLP